MSENARAMVCVGERAGRNSVRGLAICFMKELHRTFSFILNMSKSLFVRDLSITAIEFSVFSPRNSHISQNISETNLFDLCMCLRTEDFSRQ